MTVADRPKSKMVKKRKQQQQKTVLIFRNYCRFPKGKKTIAMISSPYHLKCVDDTSFSEYAWQGEFQSTFWFLIQL